MSISSSSCLSRNPFGPPLLGPEPRTLPTVDPPKVLPRGLHPWPAGRKGGTVPELPGVALAVLAGCQRDRREGERRFGSWRSPERADASGGQSAAGALSSTRPGGSVEARSEVPPARKERELEKVKGNERDSLLEVRRSRPTNSPSLMNTFNWEVGTVTLQRGQSEGERGSRRRGK